MILVYSLFVKKLTINFRTLVSLVIINAAEGKIEVDYHISF